MLLSRRVNVLVHVPPVRPRLSTLGLYQDPQTHSSSWTRVGVSPSNLYRRHVADGGVKAVGTGTRYSVYTPPTVPGFHRKCREDGDNPNPNDKVLGFQHKHNVDGAQSTSDKTKNNPGGVPKVIRGGADISPPPLQADWQHERNQLSHTTSTSVLQILTNESVRNAQEIGSKLRHPPVHVREQQRGISLVGHEYGSLERENYPDEGTRDDHKIGRLDPGLGATCQGSDTGGPWSTQKTRHINCLELLAATLALKALVKNRTKLSVLLKASNWTTRQQ